MALDAAAYAALWTIADQTGIRPEYLLPSLWVESGLDPTLQNRAGADYWGINQMNGTWIQQNLGVTPQVYITWPASQQLLQAVLPFVKGLPKPLLSGTRVEQANMLSATIDGIAGWKAARYPGDIVVSKNGPINKNAADYNGNAGIDVAKKGYITVADLETFVRKAVPNIQGALAATYALRPNETMQDPVLGTDLYLAGKPPVTAVTETDVALAVGGSAVILTAASLLAWRLTQRRVRR